MCLKRLIKGLKDNLQDWEELKKTYKPERLGSKFIVVNGKQGVGKSSLCNGIIANNYRFYNEEIVEEARSIADRLNEKYGYNLEIADHLIFTSSSLVLSFKKKLKSHLIDIPNFALPNKQFKVQYFPYGSIVYIMEADILLNCRDYKDLNMYLYNLLKYFRHQNMTIIFDCQSINRLDKSIQEIITDIFFVYEREIEDISFMKNKVRIDTKKFTWKYIHIDNQSLRMQKEFAQFKMDLGVDPIKKEEYVFIGDIHKFYKSRSATPYFYHNIEKYEYIPHIKFMLDRVSVNKYCELHPLVRTEEIKKAYTDYKLRKAV